VGLIEEFFKKKKTNINIAKDKNATARTA